MPPTRCMSKASPPASPTGWASWKMSSAPKAPIWACASLSARKRRLRLLHRFLGRRAGGTARPRRGHGEAGAGRQIRRPGARRTGWRTTIPALDLEDAERAQRRNSDRTGARRRRRGAGRQGRHQFRRRRRLLLAQRRGAGHLAPAFTAAMPAPATASASPCWRAKAPAWSATMTMPAPAMPATCAPPKRSAARAGEKTVRAPQPAQDEIASRAGGVSIPTRPAACWAISPAPFPAPPSPAASPS